jgi:hypothetical protein
MTIRATDIIEIVEFAKTPGQYRVDGLPPGMYCILKPLSNGTWHRKTRANGNGSIRYDNHRDQQAAFAAATQWGKRKLLEHIRESREYAPLEDRRQAELKAKQAACSFVPSQWITRP